MSTQDVFKLVLNNKVLAVTGGYGHLGKAIVESLIVHGGRVFVLGRNQQKFEQALGDSGADFISCDVSATASIDNAFATIKEKAGKIDALINNAFNSKGQSPERMTDEEWFAGIDGTMGSVFRCIRGVIPFMKERESGHIINVSSMYGLVAPDFSVYDQSPEYLNPPHYGAAKAGILQLTRYYASYLGKYGITVNAVTPGTFPSRSVQDNAEFMARLKSKTVLARVGTPKDVAGAFVFLSSDAANYITGQNIIIDGGWTIR